MIGIQLNMSILVVCLLAVSCSQHAIGVTVPDKIPVGNLIPTVVVDTKPGESSVNVDLPNVVSLSNDNLDGRGMVDLSVLGGMVTVNTNKTRLPNGQMTGPVIVSIFGIPVYVGQHTYATKRPGQPSESASTTSEVLHQAVSSTKHSKHVTHIPSKEGKKEPQDQPEGQVKVRMPQGKSNDEADDDAKGDKKMPVIEATAIKDKESMNAIMLKLAEIVSQQKEAIKQLKMEKSQLQSRSMAASRIAYPNPMSSAPSATKDNSPNDGAAGKGNMDFDKVVEMLRNRRNQVK